MMLRVLCGAAVVAGIAYWASRQPGGIPGTWRRLKHAANDVKDGADPVAAGRRFVRGESLPVRLNDPALRAGV